MSRAACILNVPQMDCPTELGQIERGLRGRPGIGELRPDYLRRRLHVEYDPAVASSQAVLEEVRSLGFSASAEDPLAERRMEPARAHVRREVVLGGLLFAAAIANYFLHGPAAWSNGLAIGSTAASAIPVVIAAVRALGNRTLDMNVLMTIAAIGAVALGETFEAAATLFLFGLSHWLESLAIVRVRRAVHDIDELHPPTAHRLYGTEVRDVAAATLVVGDRVLVRPGERIPADGRIESGSSSVSQAALTGESLPVDKGPDDEVFAGSLNGEGALTVVVESEPSESLAARVERLVEQAQADRSPTTRWVDRFAAWYTPLVTVLAIATAVGPPLILGSSWPVWMQRALVLLVVACPCALVISTPVTILCGLRRGLRNGLLIKGGQHLEQAAAIDVLLFDKTGTLTTGRPQVTAVEPRDGASQDDVLAAAAALERRSEHPLAAAIVTAATDRGIPLRDPETFASQRGLGVEGTLSGATLVVGNRRFIVERFPQLAAELDAVESTTQATTAAHVVRDGRLSGTIRLADVPRPDAAAAIEQLRQLGVQRIAVLSGDAEAPVAALCRDLRIDEFHANLLPADKVELVRNATAKGATTAMIGEGVNDAPALAAASLSIAFGGGASDLSVDAADVICLTSRVAAIAELLRLARRTRRRLRENFAISLGLKAAVLPLALVGSATLWMAVAADVGASLVVIFNGMRLLGMEESDGER